MKKPVYFFAALCAVLLVGIATTAALTAGDNPQWEYKIIDFPPGPDFIVDATPELNRLGLQGWELFTVDVNGHRWFLKRKLP